MTVEEIISSLLKTSDDYKRWRNPERVKAIKAAIELLQKAGGRNE